MVRGFVAVVHALSRACGVIAGVLLVAAMVIVCEMILMRYLFRAPTIWQTDFVVYSATAAVFIGAPYVLLTRGHVGIDFVMMMTKPRTRRVLILVGNLMGLLFCLAMLVASVYFFWEAWVNDWRTNTVWQIPQWIPTLPLPLGFAMLCLQYVADLLDPKDFELKIEEAK
jgi:TRAP-type C4-dicarboxylate transport system permease small subunit